MTQIPVWEKTREKMLTAGYGGTHLSCQPGKGRGVRGTEPQGHPQLRVQAQPGLPETMFQKTKRKNKQKEKLLTNLLRTLGTFFCQL